MLRDGKAVKSQFTSHASSAPSEVEQLRGRLRGLWREGLRAVMVLLSLHRLAAGEIAALLECHPSAVRRWIWRFSPPPRVDAVIEAIRRG